MMNEVLTTKVEYVLSIGNSDNKVHVVAEMRPQNQALWRIAAIELVIPWTGERELIKLPEFADVGTYDAYLSAVMDKIYSCVRGILKDWFCPFLYTVDNAVAWARGDDDFEPDDFF